MRYGQVLELTSNYRAENDLDLKIFSDDLLTVRNEGNPNYKNYGNKECRRSICWTNATRRLINNKWMLEESKDKKYIILNGFKLFVGLPILCKKTSLKWLKLITNGRY
jgi:hypothetical protein